MDRNNKITVTSCSPSQPKRPSLNRGKGWSLNRNRKNTMDANLGLNVTSRDKDTHCCLSKCQDRKGNEVRRDCDKSDMTNELLVTSEGEKKAVDHGVSRESSDVNKSVSSQETQRQNNIGLNSPVVRKAAPTITRSVSFAYRNRENSSVLWESKELCMSLSSKGRNHIPWESSRPHSSLVSPCRNTCVTGGDDRCSGGKVPVVLRNKKGLLQHHECFSSTDLIKRRSAEISQLRYALEEKVRTQQYRTSYLNGNFRNSWSDLPQSPQYCWTKRRPKSSCGSSHVDDYYEKEREPLSSLEHRNNKRNTPRWAGPHQPDSVNSPRARSSEARKLQFLVGDRLSSPYTSQKTAGLYLCQRCSSVMPQQSQESYWPLSRGEDTPSLYYTPTGSPAPRAPQLGRHHDDQKIKPSEDKSLAKPVPTADGRINYYPNCDPTIWIRSCTQEITEPLTGLHKGEVPKWLRGALIRNGPGRIQIGEHQYNHVFDGSALLHRFHFKNGRVTYQNKFLQSRSYLNDTRAQRIVVNYFGTRGHPDPCKTILRNIASKFSLEEHFTDNAQISLYPYGDSLYALTETPFIFRVDPDTLNTHEKVNLSRHIAVFTHTAHPHVDRDGTVYNLGQGVGPLGPRYHICKFPKTKTLSSGKVRSPFEQARVVGTVAARWLLNPCYMHSFAMTDNYWVIIEQPLVVSVPKILKVIVKQDALIDALQWWEKETKIHVVRRDTGRVTTTQYVTETFFFLHTINAYEDRGHIVLDIASYKNAEMLHCMFVEALKNAAYDPTYAQMFRGRPKRWVLPLQPDRDADQHTNLVTLPNTRCRGRWLKKGVVYVIPELLADIGCEVPRIYYEEYNGRHYQYFYAICSDVDHPKPGTLVKVDVVNKQHVEWSEDNVYPSEPIFVPSPHAKREDEGVVLSALLRARGLDREVCLLVLDAASFIELARVEFLAPGPVPKCLHGWFVPEGTLTVHSHQSKTLKDTAEDGSSP